MRMLLFYKQNGRETKIRSRLCSAEVVGDSCQERSEGDVWYDLHDGEIDKKSIAIDESTKYEANGEIHSRGLQDYY
jgi:hypothetical protein